MLGCGLGGGDSWRFVAHITAVALTPAGHDVAGRDARDLAAGVHGRGVVGNDSLVADAGGDLVDGEEPGGGFGLADGDPGVIDAGEGEQVDDLFLGHASSLWLSN